MAFILKEGDTAPAIKVQFTDRDGDSINLTGYTSISFYMVDGDGSMIVEDDTAGNVTVLSETEGRVAYEWQSGDTDQIGQKKAEFVVEYDDGTVETFPNRGFITVIIQDDIEEN